MINDYGTMINNGTISVSTVSNSIGAMHIIGSGINHGEIDLQDANLDIYGKLTNPDFKSYINVQASSRLTILSSGTVINNATIQINNLGVGTQVHVESGSTLDNSVKGIIYVNGELNIDSGGVINNSGTIENNSGGINNSGTIDDECGGIITGSITGNTAVNDCLPSQPTSLSAAVSPFQINLSWTAPSPNGGTAITNYNVYRGTSSGSEAKFTTLGNVTSFSDTSAVLGQTYYYYVTAVNSAGESGKSNEVRSMLSTSYDVSNQTSCLALPQSAKPVWNPNYGSPLCNLSGGKLTIPSGVSLTFDMSVENSGVINITGTVIDNRGMANVEGTILNYGTMNFNGGALNYQASLTNSGVINISASGSISNNGGNIANAGNITNNGHMTNFNGGTTNNNAGGIINSTSGGTINNNSGGTTNNNAGGIINNNSGGIYNSGGTTNNNAGGIINNNSGFIDNNVSGGTMINLGLINNSGDLQNNPGGIFTNSGVIKDGCGGAIIGTISGTAPVNTCDTIPPTTTAALSGTAGTNNWYTSSVQVILTASDNSGGSGVKTTTYSLDGGPQTTYSAPFTVSGDSNHTLAFNSTDNAGNVESPNVVYIAIDTTPPVITVPPNVTQEATGPLMMVSLGTATATDAVDGPVTVTSNATTDYPVGITKIQYSATDLAGNTATAYQKVTITDTTPPVLQLPPQITLQATGPSGATASYKANATDLVDGPITPVCSPASGSTFAYGTTTVTCTATDAHGNTAAGTFDVNVQNKIPPAISITSPGNNAMANTATVPVEGTASDIVSVSRISWKVDSGAVSAVSGITPGPNVNWSFTTSVLSPGSHTIEVNATDSAGLVAISSISITYAAPTDSIPPPTGSGQVTFTSSNGGFTSLDPIQQSSLPTSPPSGSYPLGFFSWDITGFAPATSVTITVTSPTLLPSQSQYFKLIGGTWIPIPVTISGNTMKFTISDNGPYDGNPTTGVISDPAAIADPTNGRLTGGGNIGKGTNFGFEVHSNLDKANPIRGTFAYQDRYVKLELHSNKISYLSVDPTTSQATFVGTGTYDRHYGHDRHDIRDTADTFLVSVTDPDKTGDHDTFSITVTNSTGYIVYQNSGAVKGHIEIKNEDVDDMNTIVGTVAVGNAPEMLAFDRDNGNIYVANNADGTVSAIDGRTGTLSSTITVGNGPQGIAIDERNGKIYVANTGTSFGGNTVAVIDAKTGKVAGTITVGVGPIGVAFDGKNDRLYVVNTNSRSVSVIDTRTNIVNATVPVGTGPNSVAVDERDNKIYVTNFFDGTVSVIDGLTNAVTGTIKVGTDPIDVAFDKKNGDLYVTNFGDNTVSVIDSLSDTVAGTISVGSGPIGATIDEMNGNVYIGDSSSGTISVIDSLTNTVVETLSGLDSPARGIVDTENGNVYIGNIGSDTVTVIVPANSHGNGNNDNRHH
ncbi:MAG: HYR domain-containing protein [Thaumarchaeota archaeon]|nr:HYR domain-containing protein [Nitrososphaerota archaeon]